MAYTDTGAAGQKRRVSPAEFARIANVNRSTVTRWGQSGRISIGPDGKIDLQSALRERDATESVEPRHQARKAQFDEDKARQREPEAFGGEPANLAGLGVTEKLGLLHKQASLRRLQAQAELANLELDQAAKLVYDKNDVDYLLADIGRTVADAFQSLADRYAPVLAACKGDPNALHKALEDIGATELAALNEHQRRKQEEML